jgi:hypothetical protein
VYGRLETPDGRLVGELFTDETGRFEAYELSQGRYIIKWGLDAMPDFVFEVPPDTDGFVDLGTVVISDNKGAGR